MVNGVNNVNPTHPLEQRKHSNTIINGALIGASAGAASSLVTTAISVTGLNRMKKFASNGDAFSGALADAYHKTITPEDISIMRESLSGASKLAWKACPWLMLINAAVIGAAGAGIGAIVKYAGKHKADKAKA